MTTGTALAVLKQNALFRDLPNGALTRLAACAAVRNVKAGTTLFQVGDAGDAIYGIVTGRVRIGATSEDGREIFLNLLGPGESFGEIALLDGGARTASATAVEPTALTVIAREAFLDVMRHEPVVAVHTIELLCQRIRLSSAMLEDNTFLPLEQRLAKRLLMLAETHGEKDAQGCYTLRLSQDELAHFLGVTRQIVNQHLNAFAQSDLIELSRGRIMINHPALLAQKALPGS